MLFGFVVLTLRDDVLANDFRGMQFYNEVPRGSFTVLQRMGFYYRGLGGETKFVKSSVLLYVFEARWCNVGLSYCLKADLNVL